MLPVRRARWYNWNRNYAHTDYGQPVALVVPPTANLQTNYGWGVASSRISRIEHQFQRNFPGYGMFGGPSRPTPSVAQRHHAVRRVLRPGAVVNVFNSTSRCYGPAISLKAHFDGQSIQLDEPYELQRDAQLLVTVLSTTPMEADSAEWAAVAGMGLTARLWRQ